MLVIAAGGKGMCFDIPNCPPYGFITLVVIVITRRQQLQAKRGLSAKTSLLKPGNQLRLPRMCTWLWQTGGRKQDFVP